MRTFLDPRDHLLAAATEEIRRPRPELGWTGDTDLYVAYERLTDNWSVWREDDDGKFRMVMRQRTPSQKLDVAQIIRSLVERDTYLRNNSAELQVERMIRENDRLQAEQDAKAADSLAEVMEKVYHAAASKDLKAHTGYVKPISFAGVDAKITPIRD